MRANLPADLRHKLCTYIIKNTAAAKRVYVGVSNSSDRMNLGSSSSTTPEKDDENEAAGQNQILDEFTIFVTVILTNADPEADVAIMDKASNFTIKDSKAVIILIKLLFTAEMLEANQIKHHAALLRSFFKNEKGSEGFVGRARNVYKYEQ